MKKSLIMMLLSLSVGMGACTGTATKRGEESAREITPADELRQRLAAASSSGRVLFGHHDDPVYGHTWAWETDRSDVRELTGAYPAVMSWDLGAIELGSPVNLDSVPFDRMRDEVIAQDRRGGVNTFSWHLYNPVNGHDSWDISDTTIVSRMVSDPEVMKLYDGQLDRVAAFFNSLTDDSGRKIPVIFRPWHEHTGSWFFWGERLCSPDDYRALWHRMRERMDSAGVDNVLWAYSPDRLKSAEQFDERYPGDEYVDILGTDVYHFGGVDGLERYREDAVRSLDIVCRLASERGKIPAFTETGLESVTMPAWWTEVLLPLLKEHPVAYAVVWRNAHDKPTHFYAPFPGQASETDFVQFYNDSTTVFVK